MKTGHVFLSLACAACAAATCLAADPIGASVGTTGLSLKPITRGKDAGKRRAEQSFVFHLPTRYTIRYVAIVDAEQPGKAFPTEGYIGMPAPTSCNWYHSGFLFVRVNGQEIGRTKLRTAYVAETGARAIADLVWDAKPAVVRVRFAGRPGDDKLLCEVAIEPKEAIKSLRIGLRCYPSFFTAWHKRDGDRKIATPTTTLNQGQRVELPAAEHWYAVYVDTVFDVARGEGEGPCAMLVAPGAVEKVKFNVGSYAVSTELVCKPAARSVRLALWEFPKTANAPVLASFRQSSEQWLKELREFDFTPTAVRSFDPKAELARLDKLTRPPEVRKQLGAKADVFRKRIAAIKPTGGKLGILEQADLLGLLAGYRDFLWELKLAELLSR